MIYGGHIDLPLKEVSFKYDQNNISFSFGTNQLDLTSPVLYSYKVVGLDNKWSDWSPVNKKNSAISRLEVMHLRLKPVQDIIMSLRNWIIILK